MIIRWILLTSDWPTVSFRCFYGKKVIKMFVNKMNNKENKRKYYFQKVACIRSNCPKGTRAESSDWTYFYSPLDGMLVHRRVTPSSKFAGTHLYTWVERGTMRVKCLAQEHNIVPRPGLEPGPLVRNIRSLRLSQK